MTRNLIARIQASILAMGIQGPGFTALSSVLGWYAFRCRAWRMVTLRV